MAETQLDLLATSRRIERPRKSVRKLSRAQFYAKKDSGQLAARTTLVLNGLAHHYYVTQTWPTPAELTRWMFEHGRITRENPNLVAPYISDLVNGRWVGRGADRHRVGGGDCEYLPARPCAVTHTDAHPVRIREAGSVLARFGYGGVR